MALLKTWAAFALALAFTGATLGQAPEAQPGIFDASDLAKEIAGAAAQASEGAAAAPAKPGGVVRVKRSGASAMPKKIAAGYPLDQRAEAQKTFEGLLQSWPKVEQHFGLDANDLVGATAMFVLGAYQGYYNRTLEEEEFRALLKQFRPLISGNPAIAGAADAEKRDLFEQMVILGMFMDRAQSQLQKTPNPQVEAQLKEAARGYLQQFLQTDPDKFEVTKQGLATKKGRAAAQGDAQDAEAAPKSAPQE